MTINSDGESTVLVSDIFSINRERTSAARKRGPFRLREYLRQSYIPQVSIPPEFVLNLTKIVSSIKPFYIAQLPDTWRTVVLPRDAEYVQLRPDEAYDRHGIIGATVHRLV